MYSFGRRSLEIISELHSMFHKPLFEVIKVIDIKMLEAKRIGVRQNLLFESGASTVEFPNSAHNPLEDDHPVFAFDAMPYYPEIPGGIDWRSDKELLAAIKRGNIEEAQGIVENIRRMRHAAGIIIGVFHAHGIPIVNGRDWNKDNRFNDHKFNDSPHYQHLHWRKSRNEI